MNTDQLLSELRTLDIELSVHGDRLRCSAPRGCLTPELEERISAHKPELIRILRDAASTARTSPRPTPKNRFPLSFAQERFWILQGLEPETTLYNITAIQQAMSPIDATALESALHQVVQRHEILRAVFVEEGGAPLQVVREQVDSRLWVHDLTRLPEAENRAAVDRVVEEQMACRFDLAQGPLFRCSLIRAAEDRQIIVLTIHHIICDAWSVGIFSSELRRRYEDLLSGRTTDAEELQIQYTDYAVRERARQQSDTVKAQLDYWVKKLDGIPKSIHLPFDEPRSAAGGYRPGTERFELDAATAEGLKELGRQAGATPFMVLLAVFQALLSRYSGQKDIVVGVPVSTRIDPILEPLIGCFLNTHVLRSQLHEEMSGRTLVAQVRATVLESLANSEVPFESLIRALATDRDLSRTPLFQVAFLMQNVPGVSGCEIRGGGMPVDISLYIGQGDGRFRGAVEYNAALFAPETMRCFAGSFQTFAAEVALKPDVPLEQLALATEAQEDAWFSELQGVAKPIHDLTAHEWIAQQAARTGDAIAVESGTEELTYAELEGRAQHLAHRLRVLGVGPQTVVALCLQRSVDMVVAPLAVWKAGGAYLPLDPGFPLERLSFMLQDSEAAVVITESRLLDRLPKDFANVICLDRERDTVLREGTETVAKGAGPENSAYVIYTSGSTGKPKGVEVSHRSLVNLLTCMLEEPGIAPSDRLLAVTTFSFDIAGLELFLPLVCGARVVIAPREATVDGERLNRMLANRRITMMQATPVTWRILLDAGWEPPPGFRVLCGGEAFPLDLANDLLATGAEVWNLYGPTETTIWSSIERLQGRSARISIGKPIANTQVRVLTDMGSPVPVGVRGELYIGGAGVARGYLNRPELTAEKFVEMAGERFYRTGDLVRRMPGGRLEYVGRVDHQIKLRGYRIEPAEIELVLESQPGILRAAVVMREDRPGDRRLTAYFQTAGQAQIDLSSLRKALSRSLSDPMVPQDFVRVDEFPVTPNLKVDREALVSERYRPQNELRLPEKREAQEHGMVHWPEEASNPIEMAMVRLWREILGVDRVSVVDDFFERGGHSLSAATLVGRLRAELEMELPLRSIFVHSTIRGLSNHIFYDASEGRYRYSEERPEWRCIVPIQRKGTRTPLFFVAGFETVDDTLMVLSRLVPHLGSDQPLFGFRPRWVTGGADYSSVEEVALEFLGELRAIQPHGPYLLGGWCIGGIVALEMARILREQGEEIALMLLIDTERPSLARSFQRECSLYFNRGVRIAATLWTLAREDRSARKEMIRKLVVHKTGRNPDELPNETTKYFWTKLRYRRLIDADRPLRYPGQLSLIVSEDLNSDRKLGWKDFARDGLRTYVIPGTLPTMFTEHAREVAEIILKCTSADVLQAELQPHLLTTSA